MNWVCELTQQAENDLKQLPRHIQERVSRTLSSMESDPFQGNVTALKGAEWKGVFRRSIGSYRILFVPDQQSKIVTAVRILLRSEKTYR